jgi:TetR/AcrR family transcriptional regulator, tetracycline repressor protein
MALDRAQVIKTAIDLLDEVGLDGLSLRRLAKELGVQAPALYWHFKNKEELLEQMAATISTAEAPPRPLAEGETWDAWLAERALALRRGMNRHRDGAMLAASTHPQESQWGDIEMQIEILMSAPMTAPEAMRAMITIGNYVAGFTLEEQADRMRGAHDYTPEDFEKMLTTTLDPYPRLVEALRVGGDPQSDSAFEAGVALIIGGVRQRVSPPHPLR